MESKVQEYRKYRKSIEINCELELAIEDSERALPQSLKSCVIKKKKKPAKANTCLTYLATEPFL